MSVPAVLKGTDLEAQAAKLRDMQHWVANADAHDAADTANKAKMAREWLRVVKGSAELATEATRLECIALRRIGQLGQIKILPAGFRTAAEGFADMGDLTFEALIKDPDTFTTALAIWRRVDKERRAEAERIAGIGIGNGKARHPIPVDGDLLKALGRAATALLDRYASESMPFSVSDAADEIAEDFGFSTDPWYTTAARLGLRDVVRLAIQAEVGNDGEDDPDFPAFVTYYEDAVGWVRIPWRNASLVQFRFMVQLRRRQADQMEEAARQLQSTLSELERVDGAAESDSIWNLSCRMQVGQRATR